jgi:hypothetical protein
LDLQGRAEEPERRELDARRRAVRWATLLSVEVFAGTGGQQRQNEDVWRLGAVADGWPRWRDKNRLASVDAPPGVYNLDWREERAILDQNNTNSAPVLQIFGSWTWYWDFEVTNSAMVRVLAVAGSNPPDRPGNSVDVFGPNIVERALKKAILHRKNSLFYKTRNGAQMGDLFMSLIHTCELNASTRSTT